MPERIEELDVLKGIAMILVIIGHFYHPHILAFAIWSFHMPLFVIVSGLFIGDLAFEDLCIKTKKTIRKYIIVYVSTCTAIVVYKIGVWLIKAIILKNEQAISFAELILGWFLSIVYAQGNEFVLGNILVPAIGGVWFLMALIIGQLIICVSAKMKRISYRLGIILVIVSVLKIISLYLDLPLQFGGGALFAVWLFVGFLLKKYKDSSNVYRLINPGLDLQIVILGVWVFALLWELYIDVPFDISSLNIKLNIVGFLGALSGSLCCYYLACFIVRKQLFGRNTLRMVGENTLLILAVHSFDIVCLTPIWGRIELNAFIIMLMRLVFDVVIAQLIKNIERNSKLLKRA